MFKKVPLVLLTVSLASAGCMGWNPSSGDEATPDTTNNTTSSTQTSSTAGPAATETPPKASLEANRTSGPAPLSVSFTLDGDGQGDDPLDWTLTATEGNLSSSGAELPAVVNHTYTEEGNHTATLTVEDGNHSDRTNLTVTVTPGPATDPTADTSANGSAAEERPDPVVIQGNATIGHPVHTQACVRSGVDGGFHEITPAEGNWTYTLEPEADFAIYWWSDGTYLQRGNTTGTVPSSATHAEICMKAGNMMHSYTLTLWPPGHPEGPRP